MMLQEPFFLFKFLKYMFVVVILVKVILVKIDFRNVNSENQGVNELFTPFIFVTSPLRRPSCSRGSGQGRCSWWLCF